MLPLNYRKPANLDLRWALLGFALLLLILLMTPGCVTMPKAPGAARTWNAPIYTYNPDVAGKCHITNLVSGQTIDCDEPRMYEMFCAPLDNLKTLESDVINQCEVWK